MGADLSMNPPTPPQHAALVSWNFGAVAIYRLPGEMENEARVWHRVYFLPVGTPVDVKEAVATAAKILDARMAEVDSDAVMQQTIHPDVMRDLLVRPSNQRELEQLTDAFEAILTEDMDQLKRNVTSVDLYRRTERLLERTHNDQQLFDNIKKLQHRIGVEVFGMPEKDDS